MVIPNAEKTYRMMATTQRETFGNRLREWREKAGMSISDVSRSTGISKSYISDLENNVRQARSGNLMRPSEGVVDKLARALGVPLNEARLAAGYAAKMQGNMSIPAERAVEYIEALPPETQGDALAILETLYRRHSQAVTQAKDSLPRPLGEPENIRVPVVRPKDYAPERLKRDVQTTKKKADVQVQQKPRR